MDINNMNLEELTAYQAEIRSSEMPAEELDAVVNQILERKTELEAMEQRKADAAALTAMHSSEEHIIEESKQEERTMFDTTTKEYRDAFMAALMHRATEEQRAIVADNTSYGDGLSLPVGLDTAIWDQVTTQHPVLSDVTVLRTGMAIKVTKMTPAAVSKKKDSDASTEQTFTSAEVVLAGADYHTYVTLSYSEAKMSQGAMETYLVNEVANALGEALAKDIFASIAADAPKVTKGTSWFDDIQTALGKATLAQNAVIYAPPALYYEIMGQVDSNGQPIIRDGVALGASIKKDAAATYVTVVDPAQFVLNVVSDTIVESERDAKNAQIVIGGYMRAQGCLRKTNAAAYIG